jgi:hypothetical protein
MHDVNNSPKPPLGTPARLGLVDLFMPDLNNSPRPAP